MNGLELATYEADADHDRILAASQLTNGMIVLVADPGFRHWCSGERPTCAMEIATHNQFCTITDLERSEDGMIRFTGLYPDGKLRLRGMTPDIRWIVRKASIPGHDALHVPDTLAGLAPPRPLMEPAEPGAFPWFTRTSALNPSDQLKNPDNCCSRHQGTQPGQLT